MTRAKRLESLVSELIRVREKALGDKLDINGPEYQAFDAGLRSIATTYGYDIEHVWAVAEYLDS